MSEVQTAPETNLPLLQQQQQSGVDPLIPSVALTQFPGRVVSSVAIPDQQPPINVRQRIRTAMDFNVDTMRDL